MKKLYTLIFILSLTSLVNKAQTAASITNGNWTNPLTWNCTCVPTNGYSVTISHSVTLNTPLLFSTGGITINNSGYLIQDATQRDIWINGGYMYNNGTSRFRFFLVSAGTASNAGSYTLSAFTNSVSYVNSGSITMDSMYVAGTFTNTSTGKITGDSLTNASLFTNNGRINATWSLNNATMKNYNYHGGYAFTNASVYENYDSLILTGSTWNKANFHNMPGARVNLTKNFHNYHPSTTSVFDNDGIVKVFDSWYNTDTVKGSGSFIVSDSSANSGFMKENFDFCDLTPPSSAPFVDLNSGSISSGITYCTTGIEELNMTSVFTIFPNPNNGTFYIRSEEDQVLTLSDELGRELRTIELSKVNTAVINDLPPGFYFISGKNYSKKIVVIK